MARKPLILDAIGPVPQIEIFDVGAMSEGADRYARLVSQGIGSVTAFEPNLEELESLRAKAKPRRSYHPYFLGKGGGATFHITVYPGCSSLYEPDPRTIDLFTSIGATLPEGNFAVESIETVATHRLDDVSGLPQCDYLKVDVQGAELDVMQGGEDRLKDAVVIETEVEFVSLYKNQPLFCDVQNYLRSRGFIFHKLIDVAGRCFRPFQTQNPFAPMSQILWADAVFVKDFTRLESFTDEQLLKAAAVLYEVYLSYDIAHYFLEEHDRRKGGCLSANLAKAVSSMNPLELQTMNLKLHP